MTKRRFWSEVEMELLRRNYADSRTDDLATALDRPLQQVYAKAKKLGLAKSAEYLTSSAACRLRREGEVGKAYRFTKGHEPANKGLRRPGYSVGRGRMQETQFKPEQRPLNWVPVGSTRLNGEGNLELKVAEGTRQGGTMLFNGWVPLHRLVWILAHGPIPDGYVVAFKNGRRTADAAITVDGLELLSLAENLDRNRLPPELQEISRLRGVLNRMINKRAKADDEQSQHQ